MHYLCEKHRNAIRKDVGNAEKLDDTIDYQEKNGPDKKLWQILSQSSKSLWEDGLVDPCSKPYLIVYYTFDFSANVFVSLLKTNKSALLLGSS